MGTSIDFERLISPLTIGEIVACCKSGKPIFQNGDGAFRKLFNRKRFDQAARRSDEVHVTYPRKHRRSMRPASRIDADDIDMHYAAGGTVCITGVNLAASQLQRLSKACKMSLGWSGIVDCRAYLSNDNSGYTPHFDDKTVITLQIEGCKEWQVADAPAVRNPITNAGRFPDGVYRYFRDAAELEPWEHFEQPEFPGNAVTYTLNAGDMLVVPAGVWHSACAKGHSLSIAIALNHVGAGSARDIVFSTLMKQVISDPDWRGAAPMTPLHKGDGPYESLSEIDEFLVAQLRSLRDLVDRNLEDRSDLIGTWAQSLRTDP